MINRQEGKLEVKNFFTIKMIAIMLSAAVALTSVGAGGYMIYDYEQLPKEMEEARVVETMAEPEEPEEEPEEEITEEEPEEEPEESKELSLVGTSMEKDLKIKIEDQNSKLVTGEQFVVSVTADKKNAKASTYEDKDKDGIIYINKIEAGKYTVALEDVEGYEIKTKSISVTVKDKLEYKKVDVTAEIKKESQINTAAEDTAVNNVPVESTLEDTVPLLESKVITSEVAKKDVDISGFSKAFANSAVSSVVCKKTVTQPTVKPDEPEKPTEPMTPDEEEKPTEPTTPGGEEKPTEPMTPGGEEKPTEPTTPDDTETPSEPVNSKEPAEAASVVSYRTPLRAAANQPSAIANTVTETTATVTIPKDITLYNCDNVASNSYKVSVAVTGDSSIIKEIQWSCTDEGVIGLSAKSGNSITLSKKAKGSANLFAKIIYVTDEKGTTAEASLKATVFVNDISDSSTPLKDKSGNTLYVDSNAHTVATMKDYASRDKFYTSPKYTGWQTLNGKVYYYNSDHKPLTGSQVIGGVMYNFSGDGSLSQSSGNRGIDVSKYQGNIDWGAVASSGISFAIIRAGYRGSSTGVLVEDPYFKKNIAGASKAGIKVGIYFFTQAVTEAEAVEEASMAMSLASGYRLSYPIFIDTESASNGRANGLSKSARTAIVKAFCQTVQNGGYKAGVYASKSWYNNQLNASSLSSYCIWVAQYSAECTYSGKKDMWQYTSKGKVSGIKGNVDMNISYTGY